MPSPGRVAWSTAASASPIHIVHDDLDGTTEYIHDQRLLVAEGTLRGVFGFSHALGLDVSVPYRLVRDRIEFRTPAGASYAPTAPEQHHRDETVAGFGDPRVGVLLARTHAPWTWVAGLGLSVPLGRTEANPFQRTRDGLGHQHVQLGSGTWDPVLQVTALRTAGAWAWAAYGNVRATLHENSQGYRAGNRSGIGMSTTRTWAAATSATLGIDLANEGAEKWDGRIEDEGNLGRTDAFVALGLATRVRGGWTAGVSAKTPLWSDVNGSQVDLPLVVVVSLRH